MADYSDAAVEIDVSPRTMYDGAQTIKQHLDSIVESWTMISETWEGIKIGWVGDSSDAATAFNTRLKEIQERLFGVLSDDQESVETPGVLDQVRAGVKMAASNYDESDRSVRDMWMAFCDQMVSPETDDSAAPEPYEDTTLRPITADFTDNPYPYHPPEPEED